MFTGVWVYPIAGHGYLSLLLSSQCGFIRGPRPWSWWGPTWRTVPYSRRGLYGWLLTSPSEWTITCMHNEFFKSGMLTLRRSNLLTGLITLSEHINETRRETRMSTRM